VAQISNLLYRRIPFGWASANSKRDRTWAPWRIGNPRYSRLEICATTERFMGSLDLQNRARIGAMNHAQNFVAYATKFCTCHLCGFVERIEERIPRTSCAPCALEPVSVASFIFNDLRIRFMGRGGTTGQLECPSAPQPSPPSDGGEGEIQERDAAPGSTRRAIKILARVRLFVLTELIRFGGWPGWVRCMVVVRICMEL